MKELGRAIGYLKAYWPTALGAYISLLLVTGANLVTPRLLQRIIDDGIRLGNQEVVLMMAGGILGLSVLRGLFSFLQGYLSEKASQGVAYDMRNALYTKLQSLSFSYHDQAQTGQLMTRATNDVDLVRMFTGMGFMQLVNTVVMLVGIAIILLMMEWRLALLSLLIVPVNIVLVARVFRFVAPRFEIIQQKLAELNTVLQENLAGIRLVKAFAREPYEAQRFTQSNEDLLQENLTVARTMSSAIPAFFAMGNFGTLIVIWFGGTLVIRTQLTLGELVAFSAYLTLFTFPLFMLGMIMGVVSRAQASARRVFEILDAESEVTDKPDATPLPPVRGEVAFDHVGFRYFGSDDVILNEITFRVDPGQTVALLGATGSGKSTIINLIPRFYDVTEGQVLIDGHDVRDVTVESLRQQIGIVLQETNLFSGTIRENVAFGRPEAREEEVIAAAKAAEAHDFITGFPDGYETKVGERGVGLSGGQRQRVAIARALLMDPRILILDDSTSNVDIETEHRIQGALDRLMEGRTSIVIAQRISTVKKADMILVLDEGRVVAQGDHETLLRESPIYAEIYHLQLAGAGERRGEPAVATEVAA